MRTLLQDLRYAGRLFRRAPGFALVALATLALGIGATTGVFSVVNGVLLQPLPYHDPAQLVAVQTSRTQARDDSMSAPDFLDFQARNHTLAAMAAYREDVFTLRARGVPIQADGALVTAEFFTLFGVRPLAGRFFGADDAKAGRALAVLSEGFWQREFGGDPGVVGRTLQLGGASYTVVGIAPASFAWPQERQIWALATRAAPEPPIATTEGYLTNRGMRYLDVVARLKPGVAPATARADLETIQTGLARLDPDEEAGRSVSVTSLQEQLTGDVRHVLLVLLAAVGVLLLIACINVAHLLLARATGRAREIGIRTALGASRTRLVRQLITESLLLSLAGGAAGLLMATWITAALVRLAPHSLPRLTDVHVDPRVAAFAVLISTATGLLFGLVPAWQVSKAGPSDALRAGDTRTGAGVASHRTANIMIVAQVGLSLVLLITAGLMGQSLLRLVDQDPGFHPEHVVSAQVFLPQTQYATAAAQTAFYERFLQRFASQPGAPPIAIAFPLPLGSGGSARASFQIQGQPEPPHGTRPVARMGIVSPGYFRVMGIPLQRGRGFTDAARDAPPRAVVINETLARRYFGGADPLGAHVDLGMGPDNGPPEWFTVVGVAGDVRTGSLRAAPEPELYLSYREFLLPFMTAVVRTDRDVGAVTSAVRTAVAAVDPNLPLGEVRTMPDVIAASVQQPRLRALVLGSFALLALVLATLGIYGLVSYSVATRTREFGIRVALGAAPGEIVGLVLGLGLKLLVAGAAVGVAGAWAVTRGLSGLLYGVTATDPLTYAVLAALLVAIGTVASYIPARRATRVDPMTALRSE
ncbi:MAG: ABC transporter permease [Acidobacteriota bacterium]|nr:ABC transporter permease [Acidobacteriota bacterium]